MVITHVPIVPAHINTHTHTNTHSHSHAHVPPLPLVSVNHVSYAVPRPSKTAQFLEQVLGFRRLRRPEFGFDGAWLCGLGMELHLIQAPDDIEMPCARKLNPNDLDPRADHLSFLASDMHAVEEALRKRGVPIKKLYIHAEGINQLFFREPNSNLLLEISDNPAC